MTDEQYVELAVELSFRGSLYQRRCIQYYMNENPMGDSYIKSIKQFIDIQIKLNRINLDDFWI